MQIKSLSLENWCKISKENDYYSPTFHPKFIEIVKTSYKVKSLHYVIYHKEKPVLGTVIYLKNNNVIHPSQYFYTAIWENSNSKLIIQKACIVLIDYVISKFKNICFRFSPEITDIRPFVLKGFSPTVNYTYYKNLSEINLNPKLLSRDRKALKMGIKFNWDFNINIIEQNIQGLKDLGYKADFIRPLKKMMMFLYENNFLIGVSAEIDGNMLGSALIMVDEENKIAMNLFITSERQNYDTGLHSALYINIFNRLKESGIIINDLYGANVLGIGNFKSNFDGELKPHYSLDYNYLKNKCKLILKKFLK